MKTYRVGIIGFGHMHINNVGALFAHHPQVIMAACADTVPEKPELRKAPYTREWNKEFALNEMGVATAYDDYREMLSQEDLDIVIVTSENARHAEVVEACAAAGVHVCIEKPMAPSLSDALRMARACEAAGTDLVVNWPLTWSPAARKAKALIEEGVIGRVLELKWRAGHTGPLGPSAAHAGVSETAEGMTGPERGATWWHQADQGGGALLDFCCYGAMVSYWVIGERATAALGMKANLNSQWGDADDNGVILVRFPGALALLEGTWTTFDHGVPTGPIIYGTTGTLVVDSRDGEPVVRLERGHGQTTIFPVEPLPEGRTNIAEEYVHHLETGEPLHPTLAMTFNVDVMAILDAGARSATTGQLEPVHTATWQIG
jgi:predicted dehydrogenase